MKRLYIFLLLTTATMTAWAQNSIRLIDETQDEITVNVSVYAKKEKIAYAEARQYAINSLLFRGIAGSTYYRPMIGTNEKEIIEKHANYFDSFYKERLNSFITSTIAKSKLEKDATKKKRMIFDITIQKSALRLDLENNGVIRKFGF